MTRTMVVLCGLLALICHLSAHAEEPTVVTLSCDGTRKVSVKREEGQREPISHLAVVVNLPSAQRCLMATSLTSTRLMMLALFILVAIRHKARRATLIDQLGPRGQ
jgi:hypothetical protein